MSCSFSFGVVLGSSPVHWYIYQIASFLGENPIHDSRGSSQRIQLVMVLCGLSFRLWLLMSRLVNCGSTFGTVVILIFMDGLSKGLSLFTVRVLLGGRMFRGSPH